MAAGPIDHRQLTVVLTKHFSLGELRELAYRLGIVFDDLPGKSPAQKSEELVSRVERAGRIEEFIDYIRKMRPNVPFTEFGDMDFEAATKSGLPRSQIRQAAVPSDELGDAAFVDFGEMPDLPDEGLPDTPSEIEDTKLPSPEKSIEQLDSILLTTSSGVKIYALQTERPWTLPVDAFVVPFGSGRPGGRGDLAESLTNFLGESSPSSFVAELHAQPSIDLQPDTPVLLENWRLPDTDRRLIAATAFGPDASASIEGAVTAAAAVVSLAVENDLTSITMPTLGGGRGGLNGAEVGVAMLPTIINTLVSLTSGRRSLETIILTAMEPETITALRRWFLRKPQSLRNDLAMGPDMLDITATAYALSDVLMLGELEPPLAVGVLGGWGSGKSFFMHLMQQRIAEIRSFAVSDQFPYIGHVYQIKFDAWTYAKSNLWASLMQTVFYELNDQLSREREVACILAKKHAEAADEPMDPNDSLLQAWLGSEELWQYLALPDISLRQKEELIQYLPELKAVLDQATAEEKNGDLLWNALRELKAKEQEALATTEQELAEQQKNLEEARLILYEEVDGEIAQKAAKSAWKPLESLFRQRFGELYTWVEANLNHWTSELQSPPMWKKLWQMVRYRPLEAVAFLLFAVIIGVMPLIEQRLADLQLPAAVLAVASVVVAVFRTYNQWNQLLAESYDMYREQVNQERDRIAGERDERVKKILADQRAAAELVGKTKRATGSPERGAEEGTEQKVPNIPIIEREIARLEAQLKRQRQRVGITANHVSLLDFVSSRLDEAFYEKELGMMHQVQRDLRELSDGIAAQIKDLFPRGKARVVLYIDDLDRCPPHRVVEVLEAVQLLLKTKLFVVVLAIDARFITRALETSYAGILTRRGKPSGLDYVEKIIQIPCHIQPIDPEAVGRYLAAQLEVNPLSQEDSRGLTGSEGTEDPEAPGNGESDERPEPIAPPAKVLPSEVLKIEQEEYDYLLKCCQAINLTPRAIKRLANVYKIIQIIWFRNQSSPSTPHGVELVILLLVLAERYPDLMRDLFDEIEIKVRVGLEAPELLKDVFLEHKLQAENRFLKRECERLQGDVKQLLPDIKLSEIDMRSFSLVRSFCFVSDLGYDPVEDKGWRP